MGIGDSFKEFTSPLKKGGAVTSMAGGLEGVLGKVAGPLAGVASIGGAFALMMKGEEKIKGLNATLYQSLGAAGAFSASMAGIGDAAVDSGKIASNMVEQARVNMSSYTGMYAMTVEKQIEAIGGLWAAGKKEFKPEDMAIRFKTMSLMTGMGFSDLSDTVVSFTESLKFGLDESVTSVMALYESVGKSDIGTSRFFGTIKGVVTELGHYGVNLKSMGLALADFTGKGLLSGQRGIELFKDLMTRTAGMSFKDKAIQGAMAGPYLGKLYSSSIAGVREEMGTTDRGSVKYQQLEKQLERLISAQRQGPLSMALNAQSTGVGQMGLPIAEIMRILHEEDLGKLSHRINTMSSQERGQFNALNLPENITEGIGDMLHDAQNYTTKNAAGEDVVTPIKSLEELVAKWTDLKTQNPDSKYAKIELDQAAEMTKKVTSIQDLIQKMTDGVLGDIGISAEGILDFLGFHFGASSTGKKEMPILQEQMVKWQKALAELPQSRSMSDISAERNKLSASGELTPEKSAALDKEATSARARSILMAQVNSAKGQLKKIMYEGELSTQDLSDNLRTTALAETLGRGHARVGVLNYQTDMAAAQAEADKFKRAESSAGNLRGGPMTWETKPEEIKKPTAAITINTVHVGNPTETAVAIQNKLAGAFVQAKPLQSAY